MFLSYGFMHRSIQRGLIVVFVIVILASSAYTRNFAWKNEYTLWKDVAAKSPGKILPHIELGNAFIRRGFLDHAEREFLSALSLNELDVRVHNGLAIVYLKKGLPEKAVTEFQLITRGKPEFPPAHNNLGVVYMQLGLLEEAIKEFNITTGLDPAFTDAYSNLGLAYQKKGLVNEAKKEFEKALQLSPEHRDARKNFEALLKLSQGRTPASSSSKK